MTTEDTRTEAEAAREAAVAAGGQPGEEHGEPATPEAPETSASPTKQETPAKPGGERQEETPEVEPELAAIELPLIHISETTRQADSSYAARGLS